MKLLLTLAMVLTSAPAFAQVCTDEHPAFNAATFNALTDPSPVTCDDTPACPNPTVPDDADHYAGGHIVYTPDSDVGACHPGAENTFSNGCLSSAATCIANRCIIHYAGLMYRPTTTAAQSPAVLLVPGSSNCTPIGSPSCTYKPEKFCAIKSALLAKGYVVMEMLPRGYSTLDKAHGSTGYYVNDAITQQVAMGAPCSATIGACAAYDLIDEGLFDVTRAYKFLANRSFVDSNRVAVLGQSLGAIRSLAFNRNDNGQKATISISAGSESWCPGGQVNSLLSTELAHSVDLARSAIYVLQPQNDQNLEPGSVIAHEAAENRWQYQAAVFPPVAQAGADLFYGDEAHVCFIQNQREVNEWSPTVINFLRRYGVK